MQMSLNEPHSMYFISAAKMQSALQQERPTTPYHVANGTFQVLKIVKLKLSLTTAIFNIHVFSNDATNIHTFGI